RMLSHDDNSPEMRRSFRARGVRIAEFPINEETAREAAAGGDAIVFGAPNVVRGGSHTGWTKASDMIAKGLCSVLASDYYYPAPLLATFRLAHDRVLPLGKAWDLISAAPAEAAGLADRGKLARGRRDGVASAHRRGDCGRPARASHRCRSHRCCARASRRGDCSRVSFPQIYSDGSISTLCDLLRPRAGLFPGSVRRRDAGL